MSGPHLDGGAHANRLIEKTAPWSHSGARQATTQPMNEWPLRLLPCLLDKSCKLSCALLASSVSLSFELAREREQGVLGR
eukprot:6506954-Pyramimonas_sp.AAC.1